MELRYCEECGEVVRLDTNVPLSLADHFVCENCKVGKQVPKAATTADQKSPSEDAGLEAWLKGRKLNLFSQKTITWRKTASEVAAGQEKPKSKRLRLVKNDTEESQRGAESPGGEDLVSGEQLPAGEGAPVGEGSPAGPEAECGSQVPSRAARKILFRCLHCRSPLSIRPVDRDSRLTCPQCQNVIFVTASGRLLKSSPSKAVRKATGEAPFSEQGAPPAAQEGMRRQSSRRHAPGQTVPAAHQAPTLRLSSGSGVAAAPAVVAKKAGGSSRDLNTAAGAAESVPGGLAAAGPGNLSKPGRSGSSARAKPTSAFEEHRARHDPEKTAFLTDEPTTSLERLASETLIEPLDGAGGRIGRPHALGDSSPLALSGGTSSQADPASIGADGVCLLAAREAQAHGQLAQQRTQTRFLLQFLVLVVCLLAPLLFTCVLLGRSLQTEGGTNVAQETSPILHQLGEASTKGVRRILNMP